MSKGKRHFARNRPAQAAKPKAVLDATPHLVEITKPLYGGQFLARHEGKAVFVPLTLPGEQVRVHITEEKKSYSEAEPLDTLIASADRIAPQLSTRQLRVAARDEGGNTARDACAWWRHADRKD